MMQVNWKLANLYDSHLKLKYESFSIPVGSVADPHHVDADPDPVCPFDADPDPTFHFDAVPDPDQDPSFQIKPWTAV